jgi:hypothetical protein
LSGARSGLIAAPYICSIRRISISSAVGLGVRRLLEQILGDAGAAVALPALVKRGPDQHAQA